jgi:hypothetical protein
VYDKEKMFATAVGWVTTELSTIWARYNAFLLAITFIMTAALALDQLREVDTTFKNITKLVGIAVCVLWGEVHYNGYKNLEKKIRSANNIYDGPGYLNTLPSNSQPIYDCIYKSSMLVIVLFIFLILCTFFI